MVCTHDPLGQRFEGGPGRTGLGTVSDTEWLAVAVDLAVHSRIFPGRVCIVSDVLVAAGVVLNANAVVDMRALSKNGMKCLGQRSVIEDTAGDARAVALASRFPCPCG